MDSDGQEGLDSKNEFRRPLNEASGRKYRRRSPGGGSSSSSGGSPSRKKSLSPVPSKKDNLKGSDDRGKRETTRSHAERNSEPYRHSDRNSPRGYHRHTDHGRRERRGEDYDRGYPKSSSRPWRDAREDLDYTRSDKEYQRDYSRSRYDLGHKSKNRDTYDRLIPSRKQDNLEERGMDRGRDRQREERSERYGKFDHKKGNRDQRSESSPAHAVEESSRVSSGHNLKEDSEVYGNKEKRTEDQGGYSNDSSGAGAESVAKKSKFSSPEGLGLGKEVIGGASEPAFVTDADIDAAKLAAMKAAEMVNRNLVGTGYMSADQKKKLLWGNKKSNTTTEESAHRWDTATFVDQDRQEKFNKLMGVKGVEKIDLKSDNPEVEKQREQLQVELEKQYTAGLRRRDGRTVGLGL